MFLCHKTILYMYLLQRVYRHSVTKNWTQSHSLDQGHLRLQRKEHYIHHLMSIICMSADIQFAQNVHLLTTVQGAAGLCSGHMLPCHHHKSNSTHINTYNIMATVTDLSEPKQSIWSLTFQSVVDQVWLWWGTQSLTLTEYCSEIPRLYLLP